MTNFDALFFDMDGTLVENGALMPKSTQEAFANAGMPIDIINWRGSGCTDYEVMDKYLVDFPLTDEEKTAVKEVIAADICKIVTEKVRQQGLNPEPGAVELIEKLRKLGIRPGLLTGNMEVIVAPKLVAAGMKREDFFYGGFGDHCPHRVDTARKALASASAFLGYELDPARALIIGDTPNDIACAHSVGAAVLAVPTGKYTREQLAQHQPDFLLNDLTDQEGFLEIIGFFPR